MLLLYRKAKDGAKTVKGNAIVHCSEIIKELLLSDIFDCQLYSWDNT